MATAPRASGTTRFGSDPSSLEHAAAVLRARASANGIPLSPASRVDLAASVIGADAWLALAKGATLALPAGGGQEAVAVLAAVLRRAAGSGDEGEVEVFAGCSSDRLLSEAAAYRRWAVAHLGPAGGPEALRRAALDLCAAGDDSRFAVFADVLALTANEAALSA